MPILTLFFYFLQDTFPFDPPFVRMVHPVLHGGYVLDGGALCMELMTPQVKFSFSEKATKFWKNLLLVLILLSKNSYFVKTGGRLFQILRPYRYVLNLITDKFYPPLKLYFLPTQILNWSFRELKPAKLLMISLLSRTRIFAKIKFFCAVCIIHVCSHGLRTPNKGINQRYLKNWAEVVDEICFGHT